MRSPSHRDIFSESVSQCPAPRTSYCSCTMSSLDCTLAGLEAGKSVGLAFPFPPGCRQPPAGPFHSTPLFLFSFGIFAVLVIRCPQLSDAQTTSLPWEKLTALSCELGPRTRRKPHSPFQESCCVHLCLGEICSFHYGVLGLNPSPPEKLPHHPEEQGVISFVPLPDRHLAFILLTIHEPPIPGTSYLMLVFMGKYKRRIKAKRL